MAASRASMDDVGRWTLGTPARLPRVTEIGIVNCDFTKYLDLPKQDPAEHNLNISR
jgi:hypothetical protein